MNNVAQELGIPPGLGKKVVWIVIVFAAVILLGATFGTVAAIPFPELASGPTLYAIIGMGAVAGVGLGDASTRFVPNTVDELTFGYFYGISDGVPLTNEL